MPTVSDSSDKDQLDKVSVLIAGYVHDDWSSYDLDAHLQTPSDAWRVELAPPAGGIPSSVVPGAPVEVRVGYDTVLVGRVDEVEENLAHARQSLSLSGRDNTAILLDCAAPVFVARQATLAQVVANVVRPLGISKIQINADSSYTTEKINVEPGERAWQVLQNAAEANGLWPWFAPDGTLVIGGPDYTTAPVASLILRTSGVGNNVESLQRRSSMAERYSEVTVLGQHHGTDYETGKASLKGVAKDSSVSVYRPMVVIDHECENVASALSRARKLLMDSRLKGLTLTARVKGHRTSDGVLWTPGQRVHVLSEPHGIDAVWFLMGRRFIKGRAGQGSYTLLTLKEDGVWTLDAHAHKLRHRRGKNEAAQEIVDVGED